MFADVFFFSPLIFSFLTNVSPFTSSFYTSAYFSIYTLLFLISSSCYSHLLHAFSPYLYCRIIFRLLFSCFLINVFPFSCSFSTSINLSLYTLLSLISSSSYSHLLPSFPMFAVVSFFAPFFSVSLSIFSTFSVSTSTYFQHIFLSLIWSLSYNHLLPSCSCHIFLLFSVSSSIFTPVYFHLSLLASLPSFPSLAVLHLTTVTSYFFHLLINPFTHLLPLFYLPSPSPPLIPPLRPLYCPPHISPLSSSFCTCFRSFPPVRFPFSCFPLYCSLFFLLYLVLTSTFFLFLLLSFYHFY